MDENEFDLDDISFWNKEEIAARKADDYLDSHHRCPACLKSYDISEEHICNAQS